MAWRKFIIREYTSVIVPNTFESKISEVKEAYLVNEVAPQIARQLKNQQNQKRSR